MLLFHLFLFWLMPSPKLRSLVLLFPDDPQSMQTLYCCHPLLFSPRLVPIPFQKFLHTIPDHGSELLLLMHSSWMDMPKTIAWLVLLSMQTEVYHNESRHIGLQLSSFYLHPDNNKGLLTSAAKHWNHRPERKGSSFQAQLPVLV